MTDRELLEAAARAAGIYAKHDPYGVLRDCSGAGPAMNIFGMPPWDPLVYDADALRLAVKLRLDVYHYATLAGHWDEHVHVKASFGQRADGTEDTYPDPYAATRRAIVRAAAAMCPQSVPKNPAASADAR